VQREQRVAKIWIEPLQVQQKGGFNDVELGEILALIEANLTRLLERWHEFFGSKE
jgi:hypothetical protein